jgi:hypothetical protein
MITPEINIIAVLVAAIIPNALGALYYGFLFEKPWLKSFGMTAEDLKGRNEAVIYGLAFVMSFIVAFFLNFVIAMVHKDVNKAGDLIFASHNTFGHGFLHGSLLAFTLVAPVIVSLGLFHKNTGKNILLNVVFWIICFGLMGGILDVWQ